MRVSSQVPSSRPVCAVEKESAIASSTPAAWIIAPNLVRACRDDRHRAYELERTGHEVVHVVQGIGDEQPSGNRTPLPSRAQVQHARRHAGILPEDLVELDALDPARVPEIGTN